MKSLILLLVLCTISFCSFSQDAVNKTDAQGMKQGKWIGRYPGGTLKYEGVFDRNKPTGEWKRYHENGKIKALMNYRPNSDRVFASLFDEEGKPYAKGIFEGTLRDSVWNFYSGELIVLVENYSQGKKEGKATSFDSNGKVLSEKEWKEDQLNGKAIEYDPTGIKRNEIMYAGVRKTDLHCFSTKTELKPWRAATRTTSPMVPGRCTTMRGN